MVKAGAGCSNQREHALYRHCAAWVERGRYAIHVDPFHRCDLFDPVSSGSGSYQHRKLIVIGRCTFLGQLIGCSCN